MKDKYTHAISETVGYITDPNTRECVLQIIYSLHKYGGSLYEIELVNSLMNGLPLSPLTNDIGEWKLMDDREDAIWYNVRAPRVYWYNGDTLPVDTRRYLFKTASGNAFYSYRSAEHVSLPYIPDTEIVFVEE